MDEDFKEPIEGWDSKKNKNKEKYELMEIEDDES